MRKILLRIIRELNPTIFLIEKLSFSLKLLSGSFYGQSFIKTVRGPYQSDDASNDPKI